MSRKHILSLAKLAVSAALIWALYRKVPLADFHARITAIALAPLAVVLVLLFVNTLLSTWKWQILLRADGIAVPFRKLFTSYIVGTFFNLFLPSSIGGDAYRVVDVAQYSAQGARTFASVLADRLSGFLALVCLALIAAVPVAWHAGRPALIILPVMAAAGIVTAIFFLSRRTPARALLRVMRLDRFPRLTTLVDRVIDCFQRYQRERAVILHIMAISFAFQLSVITCVYLMARSLGITAGFQYFVAFVPLIALMEAIPISIYGIGVRDAGYAFFFSFAGLSAIQTRALAILYLIANVLYALIGGLVFLFRRPTAPAAPAATTAPAEDPPAGRRGHTLLLSLLITLIIWTIFSWPLPKYVHHAIPGGAYPRAPQATIEPMAPGDHLQLLFNFWLFADTLAGHTPWGENRYEFNAGEGRELRYPDPYFLPMTLVYALGQWIGGEAFGWNLTGIVSLWLTYWFTWALLKRFTRDPWITGLLCALAIAWPYRWVALCGGSPTGFSMAWVPMLLLGIELAVHDNRIRGGWLAALAMAFAYCTDTHAFFFAVLLLPCWCLFAFLRRPAFAWRDWRAYLRLGLMLVPIAITILLGILQTQHGQVANRTTPDGKSETRSMHEILLYSPEAIGLLNPSAGGPSSQIYVGYAIVAMLALGLAALLMLCVRAPRQHAPRLLIFVPLSAGLLGLIVLALGPRGPWSGSVFLWLRELVPPYAMIRQPAKVLLLLPTLFAVTTAIGMAALADLRSRRTARLALGALALWALVDFHQRAQPMISPLDKHQEAYAAVVTQSGDAGRVPRALILPLWPGDSHYTSVYEYYVTLSRVRMMNGYRPLIPPGYVLDVFKRFETGNQGELSDMQLDELLRRGVHHILLHADLYPEQVSAFPAAQVVAKLLSHPRLRLLRQDRAVWAFTILPANAEVTPSVAAPLTCDVWFSARSMELEETSPPSGVTLPDPMASAGHAQMLDTPGDRLAHDFGGNVPALPDTRYLVRARGEADFECQVLTDGTTTATIPATLSSTNWTWLTFSCGAFTPAATNTVNLVLRSGRAEFDMGLLTAGNWPAFTPGESRVLDAACFFYAGFTDADRSSVVLHPEYCRRGYVLYGPKLPVPQGRYAVTLRYASDAPAGTDLGNWIVSCPEVRELMHLPIRAGMPCRGEFAIDNELPLLMVLDFYAAGPLTLHDVTLERLAE